MSVYEKLKELSREIPPRSNKEYPFASGVIVGNVVHLSGQTPTVNGEIKVKGIVGSTVTVEQAQEAAEVCILNLLSALEGLIEDLNKVKRIIKMNGYVASERDFTEQPRVINAASNLLNDIFGTEEKHARVALGCASLPNGAPVEIELIAEI
jgi:enamine deaminase RidA (YjgF/YER057c/UK114 family)